MTGLQLRGRLAGPISGRIMAEPTHIKFQLDGLRCAACVGRAERAMSAVDGVGSVSVNLGTRTAHVDLGTATAPDVVEATRQAGYPPVLDTVRLDIDGMHCASCVGRVETALAGTPGVAEAQVNLVTRRADVHILSGAVSAVDLAQVVTGAGYPAEVSQGGSDPNALIDAETDAARGAFAIAAALTLPVFILEMGGHMIPAFHHWIMATISHQLSWAIQFVLTTNVLVWPGAVFFRRGLPALARRAPDMNSLVALGAGAAWLCSTCVLLVPNLIPPASRAVYFEAAAVIVTLILLGRWLEARARGRTGAAIRRLMDLQPPEAEVQQPDGSFATRAVSTLSAGDVIRLRPGDRVPVDGSVLTGESHVDESMVTGEPIPVGKGEGDPLIGGTVNGHGVLTLRAERVGADTVLAQIVALVEQAQGAKLPVQAMADKVIRVFVPVVLAVAAVTILAWLLWGPQPVLSHALVAGVSVLIIACPCAMGLATPTSIIVGTGRAADMGILFRKGDALQALSETRVFAFDKTGTLTEGRPRITTVVPASGWSKEDLLRWAAAAETGSEHPIASAILADAPSDRPVATNTRAEPGIGLTAEVEGREVTVGAPGRLAAKGIAIETLDADLQAVMERGETPVMVAVDGLAIGLIGVSDRIKPESRDALRALKDAGAKLAMITGDTEKTAAHVAAELGIDIVQAEAMPADKRVIIRTLSETHGPVTFVGDGINDAPALAEAAVGVAMGTGTDVAIESADVILMSGRLNRLVDAHHVSTETLRNIRQNLFWAFAYNTALIPVAAGVLYPAFGLILSPVLAAAAMALSSVFVVSNALRLRQLKPVAKEMDTAQPVSLAAAE